MSKKRELQLLLDRAIDIADEEFRGMTDKGDVPYIIHLKCVMCRAKLLVSDLELEDMYNTEDILKLQIIGVLHDLIEDRVWTEDMLRDKGFPDDVIAGIVSVTRQKGESYSDFCARALDNKYGRIVKFADLTDNLNVTRLKKLTTEDMDRINKYLKQYHKFAKFFVSLKKDDE